jgi:hypothetical protein
MDIGKSMKKICLVITVSVCAVVLLILGSLSNVVGYQTVQSSNQNAIRNELGEKELFNINPHQDSRIKTTLTDGLKLSSLKSKQAFEGYTLFTPWYSTKTFLINNSWEIVNTWRSLYQPALPVDLLENGNLLRGCYILKPGLVWGAGDTGRVEMFDWNGTLLWYFEYANDQHCLHHDIEPLTNGNILMIAWEVKTRDEAIAAGCNPDLLPENDIVWPDHIIEVKPEGSSGGDIVWEWHVWDHMMQDFDPSKENYGVVGEHAELIDINFMARDIYSDWNHINSIDYNEKFNQILVSVGAGEEIWIIDHSTTAEEAAGHTGGNSGHGGDLLYRWGNPQSYRLGDEEDKQFFGQHDAEWITDECPGAGHITVFNNGFHRPEGDYSSVMEIIPPVDENGTYHREPGTTYGPEDPVWVYTANNPTNFYSAGQSSAQRLPNGNTLICGPRGVIFEVTYEKKIVWFYVSLFVFPLRGLNLIFQAHRYPLNYSGIRDVSFIKNNENFIGENVNPSVMSFLLNKITKFFTRT